MFDLIKNIILLLLFLMFGTVLTTHKSYGQFTNTDRYFSPNLDGVKDFIEIPFIIKEDNLQKWSLTIVRKEGSRFLQIMSHESVNPKEEQLSFTKFFSRLVAKDTPLKAPNSYLWEGRDDRGELVKDSIYYFTITAMDSWGNESKSPLIPIVVDTITPKSEFTLDTDIFSPNGDGRKDELQITIDSKNFDSQDSWHLTLSDSEGKVTKRFISSEPNTSISWDGTTDNGEKSPTGNYLIALESRDLAGNSYKSEKKKVYLVREFEKIKLEVSQPIFSPNQDGFFDNITFETYLSSIEGMEKWDLEIKNESGKIVKTFGSSPFAKVIFYEGKSDDGQQLLDGIYTSQLRAWFRSGNQPNSSPVTFKIDTQAPTIGVKLRNKILNPNAIGSGYKNLLAMHTYDLSQTNSYQISILKQNGDSILKRSYLNNHPPKDFLWDGKNEEGEVSPGKYVYVFKAKDEVENMSSVVSDPFEVINENLNIEVITDNTSISPNGDGKLDTISFSFNINNRYRNILTEGKLLIYNESQETVKEFYFTEFPETLVWDGFVDPQFSHDGSEFGPLPDGVYFFTFAARFQTQEDISLTAEKLYLDTTSVELEIMSHETVFSPNDDGNKDRIIFNNRYTPSELRPESDQFIVYISKVEEGKKVIYRRKEWKGDFPSELLWTGKDQVEEDSPEGIYRLRIETIDHAFNEKTYMSHPFRLVRKLEALNLKVMPDLLTSLPEGSSHELIITPEISSTEGIQGISYSFFLSNEKKSAFARKNNTNPVKWNLLKQKEITVNRIELQGGLYYLQAIAEYKSGNQPQSPVKKIYIDNEYPTATVNTQPLFFSPDGDNINDKLSVRIIVDDNYGIKNVGAAIFRKEETPKKMSPEESYLYHNQKQIPLKTWSWNFNSKKFDKQFSWNGKGNLGDSVESATDYVLFVRGRDKVGLPVTVEHPFLVDILVEKLSDGRLRIILNSINFKYNSDKMLGNYEKVLNLLIRMLRKFPDYRINVVGHTDSRGSDTYNNSLSIKRASRVLSYLQNQGGLDKNRLTSEGKGKQELLIPKEKEVDSQITGKIREKMIEDNYRKNRRVEFFLKKE